MILINVSGLAIIVAIVWWFWLYKPAGTSVEDSRLVIEVAGGSYSPARIALRSGQPTSLTFLRKDPSPCAEMVVFPDLDLSASLDLENSRPSNCPPSNRASTCFIVKCRCIEAR